MDVTETAKLTASDGGDDNFGWSVSVIGGVAVVGAPFDNDAGDFSGSAYVFITPPGGWVDMTETAKLTPSNGTEFDQFGISVSVTGGVAVVGAVGADGAQPLTGTAHVFVVFVDSDGDGVPDDLDVCPGFNDLDDVDNDGVPDLCDVCPGDLSNSCNQDGSAASEIIASNGGLVATPDGSLTLEIDAGDLPGDSTISVTEITAIYASEVDLIFETFTASGTIRTAYNLEPDGLTLTGSVTLTIVTVEVVDPPDPVRVSAAKRRLSQAGIYLLTDSNGDGFEDEWVSIPTRCKVVQNPTGTLTATCTAELNHFSTYGLIVPTDTDGDGIPDLFPPLDEATLGTDPNNPDTDGDGLTDGEEVDLAEFGCPSPTVADSDADGLSDGLEISLGLDPCNSDFDADGLPDGVEIAFATDPFNPDTDGDGLLDGTEVDIALGTGCPNPLVVDSDGDGLSDGQEVNVIGSNPCSTDTDGDGVLDDEDPLPTDPGVTNDFAADMANDIAAAMGVLPLEDIVAPNDNARKGRRNSLANRIRNASKKLLQEDYSSALALLNSVLAKMDGIEPPSDWVLVSEDTIIIVEDIELLISLIELEL